MMRLFALALALLLVGCEARAADPIERGKQVYRQRGCGSCHQIGSDGGTIGPPLGHIATVAATRKPGADPADYIRESIVDPGAYVVPGYPDTMSRGLARGLSDEDLDDLVRYLLTLK